MFVTWVFTALLLGIIVLLHVNVVRAGTRYSQTKGETEKIEWRRAIKGRNNHLEYTIMYSLISVLLEYQGMPIIVIIAAGLAFVTYRGMYTYSLLVAEQYVDGKLAARPTWRMRGMKGTRYMLVGLALLLILVSFRNIFHG